MLEFLSSVAGVCIVGDDDQSIYSFKHPHPEGIRDWITINVNADDLQLSECRRCPTTVVHMANSLIRHNQMRLVPTTGAAAAKWSGSRSNYSVPNLGDEVAGVADLVRDLTDQGTPPGDILILAQRGVIGTPIYEALQGRNVPVRSYYSEAEIDSQDAQRRFALMKLLVHREDRVALRWLVGLTGNNWNAAGYRRVREHCELTGLTPWQTLAQLSAGVLQIPYTGNIVAAFDAIVAEVNALEALPDLAAVIDALLPAGDNSVRDLRDLAVLTLQQVGANDREEWLFSLMQAISQPEIPSEIHDVKIISLHKSKGLSAAVTIIAGCVEGLLPKQPAPGTPAAQAAAEIEEQRRLFFVGISRVKSDFWNGKPGTLFLRVHEECR